MEKEPVSNQNEALQEPSSSASPFTVEQNKPAERARSEDAGISGQRKL